MIKAKHAEGPRAQIQHDGVFQFREARSYGLGEAVVLLGVIPHSLVGLLASNSMAVDLGREVAVEAVGRRPAHGFAVLFASCRRGGRGRQRDQGWWLLPALPRAKPCSVARRSGLSQCADSSVQHCCCCEVPHARSGTCYQ